MLDLTNCPDPACGAVAEIADSILVGGMDHVRTRCLSRHVFLLPAERVRPARSPRRPPPR